MKSQVLHTVWYNISGEAVGEIWNWSLLGVKGLNEICTETVGKMVAYQHESRSVCGVFFWTRKRRLFAVRWCWLRRSYDTLHEVRGRYEHDAPPKDSSRGHDTQLGSATQTGARSCKCRRNDHMSGARGIRFGRLNLTLSVGSPVFKSALWYAFECKTCLALPPRNASSIQVSGNVPPGIGPGIHWV